jgi:phytoene/squalene synthetase
MFQLSSSKFSSFKCSVRRFTSASKSPHIEHCIQLVRDHDYESFLIGLVVPRQHRNAYYTIRAFNVEIASIKDQVKGNSNTGRVSVINMIHLALD